MWNHHQFMSSFFHHDFFSEWLRGTTPAAAKSTSDPGARFSRLQKIHRCFGSYRTHGIENSSCFPGKCWFFNTLLAYLSSVFFVLWPLYTGRQTYAKLTQAYAAWKVAYAVVFCLELLTRVVTQGFFASRSEEVSFEATLSIVPEVASLPFILAFCGFISFHFGLLWLHLLLWGTYGWGSQLLTQDLRGGYAVLTRGELVASDKCIQMYSNSQLQGHQILQESQSLMFENIIWKNPLTQVCLRNDLSSTDTRSAYAAYATVGIFRYCAYALFFYFPFLHSPFILEKNAAHLESQIGCHTEKNPRRQNRAFSILVKPSSMGENWTMFLGRDGLCF